MSLKLRSLQRLDSALGINHSELRPQTDHPLFPHAINDSDDRNFPRFPILITLGLQNITETILELNITGLSGIDFDHYEMHFIDRFRIIHNELALLITAIDLAPEHQAGIGNEQVANALEALGEHHRFALAGEVFELEDSHFIALFGDHGFDGGNHGNGADTGLFFAITKFAKVDGGQEAGGLLDVLEGVIGDVEAENLLFEAELFVATIVSGGGSFGDGVEFAHLGVAAAEEVKDVLLATFAILGTGLRPIHDEGKVSGQLFAVVAGVEAIEGSGMDQGFKGFLVGAAGVDAIAQIREGFEGTILAAHFQDAFDGPITEVADGGEAEEDALADGGEVNAGGVDVRGFDLDAHAGAVVDVALDFVLLAAVNGQQGCHVFDGVVGFEVSGLVGDVAVGGGVAFVEAVGGD